jgi:hypothetical protein
MAVLYLDPDPDRQYLYGSTSGSANNFRAVRVRIYNTGQNSDPDPKMDPTIFPVDF